MTGRLESCQSPDTEGRGTEEAGSQCAHEGTRGRACWLSVTQMWQQHQVRTFLKKDLERKVG